MHQEHPIFTSPAPEAKLWRYMDVNKLIALLETCCLFFARADRLGDPCEGALSPFNYAVRPHVYPTLEPAALRSLSEQLATAFREQRRHTFVSCWHENKHESAAMWKLYLKSDEGIAIQTTFDRLKRAFALYGDRPVFIGQVRYLDYEKEFIPESNSFSPLLHKRRSFAHENEVRAIIDALGPGGVLQPRPLPNTASMYRFHWRF